MAGNRFLFYGDCNHPGQSSESVNNEFLALSDQLALKQHIGVPTHYSTEDQRENILDHSITFDVSPIIEGTTVIVSHYLTDYCMIVCDLDISRTKSPSPTRLAHNIRRL